MSLSHKPKLSNEEEATDRLDQLVAVLHRESVNTAAVQIKETYSELLLISRSADQRITLSPPLECNGRNPVTVRDVALSLVKDHCRQLSELVACPLEPQVLLKAIRDAQER